MHEPISEVPNTKVRIWIFLNTRNVEQIAIKIEIPIERNDHKIGLGLLKINRRIIRTTESEITEITVISRDALEELL